MSEDIRGIVVPEEEVARDLGFADVFEFRRWRTETGHKLMEAEYALGQAKGERDNFRRIGMRMMNLLERIRPVLATIEHPDVPMMVLAIGVLAGKEADWGGKVRRWLETKGDE